MAENIRELIEQIQHEGIRSAQEKAAEIEAQARKKAEAVIEEARAKAQKLLDDAKDQIAKAGQSSEALLKQSARDMILNLKKEINTTLEKIILNSVSEALNPQELFRIIALLIKEYADKAKGEVIVSLKKEDLEVLEKDFLKQLKEELKKPITLKVADNIQAGFVISYDSGKSYFDFSDKALAEYIGGYLKPKLKTIFNL